MFSCPRAFKVYVKRGAVYYTFESLGKCKKEGPWRLHSTESLWSSLGELFHFPLRQISFYHLSRCWRRGSVSVSARRAPGHPSHRGNSVIKVSVKVTLSTLCWRATVEVQLIKAPSESLSQWRGWVYLGRISWKRCSSKVSHQRSTPWLTLPVNFKVLIRGKHLLWHWLSNNN